MLLTPEPSLHPRDTGLLCLALSKYYLLLTVIYKLYRGTWLSATSQEGSLKEAGGLLDGKELDSQASRSSYKS